MPSDIGPYTPIPHSLAQEVGLVCAAVYGVVWRYCQMEEGACRASLDKLGSDINVDRATVMRSIKKLCELGYLIDQTPGRRNAPHTYTLSKSVAECNSTSVVMRNSQKGSVADDNKSVAYNNSSIEGQAETVAESHLKKDSSSLESYPNKVPPKDSLTPNGVVGKPTLRPKTIVKDAFENLTGLKMPTTKSEEKAWWGWYGQILGIGGDDPDRSIEIMTLAVEYMDGEGLTINKPKSIIDFCRAVAAGRPLVHKGQNGQAARASPQRPLDAEKAARYREIVAERQKG